MAVTKPKNNFRGLVWPMFALNDDFFSLKMISHLWMLGISYTHDLFRWFFKKLCDICLFRSFRLVIFIFHWSSIRFFQNMIFNRWSWMIHFLMPLKISRITIHRIWIPEPDITFFLIRICFIGNTLFDMVK